MVLNYNYFIGYWVMSDVLLFAGKILKDLPYIFEIEVILAAHNTPPCFTGTCPIGSGGAGGGSMC